MQPTTSPTPATRRRVVAQPSDPLPETDEKGDYIFRFALNAERIRPDLTLEDYCRETLTDLLRLVRLYSNGRPVIIEAFSLANDNGKRIALRSNESQPQTSESA